MLYGRVFTKLASGLVVAGLLAGTGVIASVGLPRAEAAGAVAVQLPAAEDAGVKVAAADYDRSALVTATYRKVAPAPATLQPAVTVSTGGRTRAASTTTAAAKPSSGSEIAQARAILAGLIRRYPILKGTTVTIGKTPGGYQAVAYYQSGRIVISPSHTASLNTILKHEVMHIVDWRDNGKIDWGEKVPS